MQQIYQEEQANLVDKLQDINVDDEELLLEIATHLPQFEKIKSS